MSSTIDDHNHDLWESYFLPGEIILHAEHDGTRGDPESLNTWVNALWEQCCPSHVRDDKYPIRSFLDLGGEGGTTSFVKLRVVEPNTISAEMVEDSDTQEDEAVKQIKSYAKYTVGIVNDLNKKRGVENNGIKLGAAAPNWMFSTTPHGIGHPGPGGWPRPNGGHVPSTAAEQLNLFDKDQVDEAIAAVLGGCSTTQPVNVVILDTAPPVGAIGQAVGVYTNHQLLQNLSQKLHVCYAADMGIELPPRPPSSASPTDPNENPNEHYTHKDLYKVSDHGLFIAGIIHEFAPDANIYLIEVLNQFGMGTIETICAGIKKVTEGTFPVRDSAGVVTTANLSKNIPLIVNSSLTISFLSPLELEHIYQQEFVDYDVRTMEELKSLRCSLYEITQTFDQARIIAAAGNDGKRSNVLNPANLTDPNNPPHAYCPAAFEFVQGVGAVNKDGSRAWYSNIADEPGKVGLMTFGGKMNTNPTGDNISDDKAGILGVYIGKFPVWNSQHSDVIEDTSTPTDGWARWSGTSFATGIMSAMFARAAEHCINIKQGGATGLPTDDFYQKLIDVSTTKTLLEEPVLTSAQN